MRALVSCLTFGLIGVACGTSGGQVDESRLPEDFSFRWRVPSRVDVTETVTSPAGSTELAYSAELVREDDHLLLRHLDGEVRRLGEVVVGFEDRQRVQARTAYALADVTDAIISPEGRVLRCVESPALRQRASSYFEALPKATRFAYEIQVRDAVEVAVAKQTCIDRWQSWVSAWIGFDAMPGLDDHWNGDTEIRVGETPKIQVYDVHVGWLKKGGVRVTRRQEIDGSALDAELVPLASALTVERKSPIVADRLVLNSATWLATADIDPKTLRPRRIEWVRTLRFALDGMTEQRVTRRAWTFEFVQK